MDAPLSNNELTGILEIAKNFGSVGWAIVAWFAFKAKDALVNLCKAAAQYLESIANSNKHISSDIAGMRQEMLALYDRIDEHEREFHGTARGPRIIPRSSPIRRASTVSPPSDPLGEDV